VWCQEEARNMGAWDHIDEFVLEVIEELGFEHTELRYAGRMSAASPATGQAKVHAEEQEALVQDALQVGKPALRRIAARKAALEARNRGK
jgi:2-oxoglutarate dehydrogenase E1 component